MKRMQVATLTRRQLIDMLLAMEGAGDDTPVIGYVPTLGNYVNIDGVDYDALNGDIAITINIRDNYDSRQW